MKLKWGWVEGEKALMYSIDGGATWHLVGTDPKPDAEEQQSFPEVVVEPKPKRGRKGASHRAR